MKSKTFEAYTLEKLAEKNHTLSNYIYEFNLNRKSECTPKWECLYSYAAYYFDNPTESQRNKAFRKIRSHYSNLVSLNAIPAVNSRNELLSWVCKTQSEITGENLDCNVESLKKQYGPNAAEMDRLFDAKLKLDL